MFKQPAEWDEMHCGIGHMTSLPSGHGVWELPPLSLSLDIGPGSVHKPSNSKQFWLKCVRKIYFQITTLNWEKFKVAHQKCLELAIPSSYQINALNTQSGSGQCWSMVIWWHLKISSRPIPKHHNVFQWKWQL